MPNNQRQSPDLSRLSDLLIDPRETLDVEIKDWLDLSHNEEHKATLAKALLALANHGGGYVVLGFREIDSVFTADHKPPILEGYSQDSVNGIVQKYAEPPFHCSAHHVKHPTSESIHFVIGVPGGHRVPIRAKRDGPNKNIVKSQSIYIRRPGPTSEEPRSGREWDELFKRCLDGRRDELLDQIRTILMAGSSTLKKDEISRLERWTKDCEEAWEKCVRELPSDDPRRFSHGSYTFAYQSEVEVLGVQMAG